MNTTTRNTRMLIAVSSLALCSACTVAVDPEPEDANQQSSQVAEGNGNTLNGNTLNGDTLNGNTLNGDTLNGTTLNGNTLNGVLLKGSAIAAFDNKKHFLIGSQLIGAKLTGQLDDGSIVTIRIDDVEKQPTKYWGDSIHLYTIAFRRAGQQTWKYVCGTENGNPVKTIPLRGKWNYEVGVPDGGSKDHDPDAITFSCDGYALFKCVELGYEPWIKYKGKWLDDYHQACTRMLRTDYCGNGQSWTVNGTIVNLYDKLGVQKDEESWPMEAEWDEDGARCLSHQRIQNLPTVPSCSFPRSSSKCGNPTEWSKSLLVSEAQ